MLQHVDTFMIDNMCLLCSRSKYFFVNNIAETNSLNSMVHVDFYLIPFNSSCRLSWWI
jgi:hypothetical protein